MSDSLRDQLMKSGLAGRLKAKPRLSRETSSHARSKPRNDEIDLARAYALRDRDERAERARIQREAEQRAREKKERRRKLSELLGGQALNLADADIARHFPHRDKIRRIYVSPAQLPRLNAGDLGIVQLAGRYLLVNREIALAVRAVDADALVLLCEPDAAGEDDIPADLVW